MQQSDLGKQFPVCRSSFMSVSFSAGFRMHFTGFFALGVKYYHVQESFAIINRFLDSYGQKESEKMSIRRMVNSSGREKGEKQCLNKKTCLLEKSG